jgi:hypothetical protein
MNSQEFLLDFSLTDISLVGNPIRLNLNKDIYESEQNSRSSGSLKNTVSLKVSDTLDPTLDLTSNQTEFEITNCDTIQFTANFTTGVVSPVILQITDSSNNIFSFEMTPSSGSSNSGTTSGTQTSASSTATTFEVGASITLEDFAVESEDFFVDAPDPSLDNEDNSDTDDSGSSVSSETVATFTSWEANWSASSSYSEGLPLFSFKGERPCMIAFSITGCINMGGII